MKDDPLLFVIIMSILIAVALAISSTALYFTQTQSGSFSIQEVTDLKLLTSNIFISSGGCLTSKCFTDDIALESNVDCKSCSSSRSLKNQSLQGFAQMQGGVFSGDSVLLGSTSLTESELSCVSTFQFPSFATKSLSSQDRLTLPSLNGTIVYDTDLQQLSIFQNETWLFFGDSTIASVSGTSGQIVNNGTLQNPVLGLVATSVTPGTYTNPSIQVDQFGRTISISNGTSGVTSITGSSSIQVTGTSQIPILNLTDTTVTPGSFTFTSLTVDQKGRISTISSNSIVGSSQIDVTGTSIRTISLNASVQDSIDAKLPLIGGTVTGSILNTFSTTAAIPQFAIGTGTGIYSSATNTFNIATNGVNQFQINSSGVVSISQLSNGVVKCSSQILSSSTIINADIADGTIHNEKLFSASSTSTASSVVLRDSSQHFSARSISVIDNPSNPTDVTNKAYVDAVSSLGLVIHPPVQVVDTITNQSLTGLPIIDGVQTIDNDRILLTVQTNPLENGAWVAHVGAWVRPTDFTSGQSAATAYFLVQSGTQYEGSSWGCTTPSAIVDTDPLSFSLFSLPQTISGTNEGSGEAIFRNVMSNNMSFKTITQSSHIVLTGSSLELNIATDAVSTNTASTIVTRDGSGNFEANSLYLNGSIVGTTNSRTVNNIVSNTSSGTSGNLASFASDKIIQDSGVAYDLVVQDSSISTVGQVAVYTASKNIAGGAFISSLETVSHAASTYMPLAGGIFTGDVSFATHNITNVGNLNGKIAADLVTNIAATSNTGNLAQFSSTTGFDVSDSKVVASNVVTNSGTGTNGNVAYFTGNKVIADSGIVYASLVQDNSISTVGQVAVYTASKNIAGGAFISSLETVSHAASTYMPLAGGIFTGDVSFATHNITNVGNLNGKIAADLVTNVAAVSNTGNLAQFSSTTGFDVSDSKVVASNVITNSGTGANGNVAYFTGNKVIADSGVAYGALVQDNSISTSGQVAVYTGSKNIAGGAIISSLETVSHASSTYMPLAGGTFTGDVNLATNNITNVGNLNGKIAADLVTNIAATSNTGNLAQFSSTTGFDVSDSKVVASNVVTNSGTATNGNVAYFTGNKVIADSSVAFGSLVTDNSVSTSGQVAVYTASKNIAGGALITSLLTTVSAASIYMPLAGGTFSGAVNFGANAISNASTIAATSTISATTFNASAPTGLTSFAQSGQSISFTGGTGKVIDLATFTTTLNSADWAITSTSTGEAKYTGTATKTHDIIISVSLQPITTACNFQIWITKNGSTTAADYIAMDFAASSITNYTPFTVTRKLSLVTNDRVQLAGLVTGASPSINFKWVKIMITSCP